MKLLWHLNLFLCIEKDIVKWSATNYNGLKKRKNSPHYRMITKSPRHISLTWNPKIKRNGLIKRSQDDVTATPSHYPPPRMSLLLPRVQARPCRHMSSPLFLHLKKHSWLVIGSTGRTSTWLGTHHKLGTQNYKFSLFYQCML